MHATSKGICKDAAKFSAMALKRMYNFPIAIYTGEFDPNLVSEACGHNMLQDRPKHCSEITSDFCLDCVFKQSLNLIGLKIKAFKYS
jgi:hypothetical protein